MQRNTLLLFLSILAFAACKKTFPPKPRGYPHMELPTRAYKTLRAEYPYSFEYSVHAEVRKHRSGQAEPYWIDIVYPAFDATVELTYKPLSRNPQKLVKIESDARRLAYKHRVRAYAIESRRIKTASGREAVIFELEGEVPSQFQFYTTDSTRHFLRGAVYFNTALKNDSLVPVIAYIRTDMLHLLNTLTWK